MKNKVCLAGAGLFSFVLACGCSGNMEKIEGFAVGDVQYWVNNKNKLVTYVSAAEGDSISFLYDRADRLNWIEMANEGTVHCTDVTYSADGTPLSAVVTIYQAECRRVKKRKFLRYEISAGKVSKIGVVEDSGASYEISYLYSEGNPIEIRTKGNAGTVINKIEYTERVYGSSKMTLRYILSPELPYCLYSQKEIRQQTFEFREDPAESLDI